MDTSNMSSRELKLFKSSEKYMHDIENGMLPEEIEQLENLRRYRIAATEKLTDGQPNLIKRIMRKNPFRIYPEGSLNNTLQNSPPRDYKSAPTPCTAALTEGGGSTYASRDDKFNDCFAWFMPTKDYAAEHNLSNEEALELKCAYQKWWGIISLHNDDTYTYPPSDTILSFWKWYSSGYKQQYLNWCYRTGRHGAIPALRNEGWEENFKENTLPMYRTIYGPRAPLEPFWQ